MPSVYGMPDGDGLKKLKLVFHVRKAFRVCQLEHEAWSYVISFCLKLNEPQGALYENNQLLKY